MVRRAADVRRRDAEAGTPQRLQVRDRPRFSNQRVSNRRSGLAAQVNPLSPHIRAIVSSTHQLELLLYRIRLAAQHSDPGVAQEIRRYLLATARNMLRASNVFRVFNDVVQNE